MCEKCAQGLNKRGQIDAFHGPFLSTLESPVEFCFGNGFGFGLSSVLIPAAPGDDFWTFLSSDVNVLDFGSVSDLIRFEIGLEADSSTGRFGLVVFSFFGSSFDFLALTEACHASFTR